MMWISVTTKQTDSIYKIRIKNNLITITITISPAVKRGWSALLFLASISNNTMIFFFDSSRYQ